MTSNQEMGCGGCGCFDFHIFKNEEGDLVAKCQKCRSYTVITARCVLHYENWSGLGGLCPMDPPKKGKKK
jgi:hypothetical protein